MGRDRDPMTSFAALESAATTIAAFADERFRTTGLCLVATLRADGWPRISPMEVIRVGDHLYVGSMPAAVKARDLQRDDRCCVITPVADREDLAGEVKLWCHAVEVHDEGEVRAVAKAMADQIGFDPGGPGDFHLFRLEPVAGAHQRVHGDRWCTTSWREGDEVVERSRT
jgi:hypothetical protein